MRAVVIYESMFGNTRAIAEGVGRGLRTAFDVDVVPVRGATPALVASADLLVVGGPTHVHGLTSRRSRTAAADMATKDATLAFEVGAEAAGLRDWFRTTRGSTAAAAFDTRIDAPALITGRASRGIARRLRRAGCRVVADPMSFLVDKRNQLLDGELERAEEWGRLLATHRTADRTAAM